MAELQEGIYHAPGMRPDKFFAVLFLKVANEATVPEISETLKALWQMYGDLKRGVVRDLPGQVVPAGNLTVLIGYGQNVFLLPSIRRAIPQELRTGAFRSPLPTGGGPLVLGSGLRYSDEVHLNVATEEICLQFIASTELAVNRAIVETWKLLQDLADEETETAALQIVSFQTGFQRDDHRSWIDFHDGLSNLKSSDRHKVITIKETGISNEDFWTVGGTYLAFIRLGVNLVTWRNLSRTEQEILVGRDKLTGCPLVSVSGEGVPSARAGCPVAGTQHVSEDGNENFFEPPPVGNRPLSQSHVQRANHHNTVFDDPDSLRIFRQGYEFLEALDVVPGFRVGLNFVSFQDTPRRLIRMLQTPRWLGRTNFGGDENNQPPGMDKFLTVLSAGVFLAPPAGVEGEAFPGSKLFE